MVGLTSFDKDLAAWTVCWSRWKPPHQWMKMSWGGSSGQIQACRASSHLTAPEHGQMLNWDRRVPPTGHSREDFNREAVRGRCDQPASQPEERRNPLRLPGCPQPWEGWPLIGLPGWISCKVQPKSHSELIHVCDGFLFTDVRGHLPQIKILA